ncbi:sterile alpha motif domain-containing protein 3-like isoform X2 [Salvelinus fontinalis]|uniref:sterile alpha motif domain-containing protein 3-like isoform X2 n=1 Tax=Salvelinus fontinalis TaxID=8038 RepID=UPI0024854827|nr:sterile alpha motif domain-containing protein 3-like isoform X2 [Salvelinus fontinalis]
MSKIELLREFLNQKLTVAAEEIFGVVEKTIAEYLVDVFRTKEENERLRGLLMVHRGESDCHQQAEAAITLVQVAPEQQQSCSQEWGLHLRREDPEPTMSQCKEEDDTYWISEVEEHIQMLESDPKDPDQVSTPEDFTFQMETEGSVNEAIKLKVILNDNRIEKVILPSQPDSLNELISTLKEKLHLNLDFRLLYEDPHFNNELFNLETIEDLPSPRATVKVLRIRHATNLDLTGLSATELQDAPPERLGRWPEVFVIPTFSMEVEFALREGNCAYLRHETVLKITRDQKHNILDRMAWTIFNFKAYPSDRQFAKAAETLVTKHPCLKEPGSKTGCDGWKNSLKFKMGNYRQKLRRVGFPEVAVNGGRRSKHRPDNEHARSNIKRARRAEVNFLPNFPQGENEASLEKQRLEMVHEMTKENRDLPLINQHMQKTFAFRRQEIVKSSPSVEHLRTRWPALFLEAQVHAEFQRITNQSLQQTFYAALDLHTPRLLTLFREKEGKSTTHGGKFSSILRVYNEQVGELSNPGILDGVSILSVVGQHNEVVGGIPIRPAHVSIVLEDKIVMTNSCSWPDALMVVFGLLYSLHLNYPKALGSTFEFMQKVFLNLDDGKLKPKLLALKNELLV